MASVYVIDNNLGHVKIGWSQDPWARRDAISAGSPGRLDLMYFREMSEAQARSVERKVHRDLKAQRIGKEWFVATTLEAVAAIDRALKGTPLEEKPKKLRRPRRGDRNPVSVKLFPDEFERLVAMAIEDDRTLGNFIAHRLRNAMDRIEADHVAALKERGRKRVL